MKKTILKAIKESGKVLKEMFWEDYTVRFKDSKNIVTPADKESERVIIEVLQKNFPEFNILSEERNYINRNSEYTWVIDPLDGTTNFIIKNPFFCSSIALVKKNKVLMSAVNSPFMKEIYFAERGRGAFLNEKEISVSKRRMKKSIVTYCSPPEEETVRASAHALIALRKKAVDVRRIGAGELELCYVAAGRVDGFFVLNFNSPWDVAAGSLIVKEAGGRVTNLAGRDWNINDRNIIASNGIIHRELLRILNRCSETI